MTLYCIYDAGGATRIEYMTVDVFEADRVFVKGDKVYALYITVVVQR
jgi:hypothetical protein